MVTHFNRSSLAPSQAPQLHLSLPFVPLNTPIYGSLAQKTLLLVQHWCGLQPEELQHACWGWATFFETFSDETTRSKSKDATTSKGIATGGSWHRY